MPERPRSRNQLGQYAVEYPDNWQTWIVPRIKRRSGYHCESCGVKNGKRGWWTGKTFNVCGPDNRPPEGARVFRISLEVVPLDHNPWNCDLMDHYAPAPPMCESNLRALCARCAARIRKPKTKQNKRKRDTTPLLFEMPKMDRTPSSTRKSAKRRYSVHETGKSDDCR